MLEVESDLDLRPWMTLKEDTEVQKCILAKWKDIDLQIGWRVGEMGQ